MKINNNLNKFVFAIDVGTNSIHGIIASIDSKGSLNVIAREKESIRLGQSIIAGRISQKGIDDAVRVMKNFSHLARNNSALIKACATSAVREAENKDYFVKSIFEETGIDIEIISGEREGELIYKGISSEFPLFGKRALMLDIGGGSTELILAKNGNVNFLESLKLGAIRTSKLFFEDYRTSDETINEAKSHIKTLMSSAIGSIKEFGYDIVIGTSGTIQALGKMALSHSGIDPPDFLNGISIDTDNFKIIFKEIESISKPEKRADLRGLDSSRADIITAGELILQNILIELNVPKLLISSFALREGIIIDTFEKMKFEN